MIRALLLVALVSVVLAFVVPDSWRLVIHAGLVLGLGGGLGAFALHIPAWAYLVSLGLMLALVCGFDLDPSRACAPVREETAEDWDWPRWAS